MKIMLLSAATGGGHLRAAHAVEQYIRDHTDVEVVSVDTLKAIAGWLDKIVCGSYLFMAKHTPKMFGKLYKQTNKKNRFSSLVPKLCGLFSNSLMRTVEQEKPDAIITTHPFAAEMIGILKKDGRVTCPLICVVTDYGPHLAYIVDQVDAYITGSEHMLPGITALGAAPEKVHPFGIPVHDVFFAPGDREGFLRELELDPGLPTLLFMAGSFGVSNIITLYRELEATDVKMQIIVITGRNQKLYEAFEKEIASGTRIPTRLVFFTNEVEKYMHASDLLVTKPGGLTVSEALASNLPMAVFDAIPGQEEDNADFLVSHGMGVRLRKGGDFAAEISSLLKDEEKLLSMRKNCEAFDKSQSVPQTLELVQTLLENGKP